MKKYIPNLITLLSLFSGCFGITEALSGNISNAMTFIWAGAVFDFLDGLVARALNANSKIGEQLDSLCDLITFGVLPAMMTFATLKQYFNEKTDFYYYFPYCAFIFTAFIALRLARFNVSNSSNNYFVGIPSPAGGLIIAVISLLNNTNTHSMYFSFAFFNPYIIIITTIIMSLLLISKIKFMAFKIKEKKLQSKQHYLFIILSFFFIMILKYEGILLSSLLYIIFSIFNQKQIK